MITLDEIKNFIERFTSSEDLLVLIRAAKRKEKILSKINRDKILKEDFKEFLD